MSALLISPTFWLLFASFLSATIWMLTKRIPDADTLWSRLWDILADRRLLLILLLADLANVSYRVVSGYINPTDYVQDVVASRQFLLRETMYPADFRVRGVAEVAAPMPGREWIEPIPVFRRVFQTMEITAPFVGHPPLLGILTAPAVATFGMRGAYLTTVLVTSILLCVSLLWILRELHGTISKPHYIGLIGLLFGWFSVNALLRSGQPAAILLFLLVGSWLLLRRGRAWAAGIPIGIAASIQVFPAFFLVYFALRSWRSLVTALTTIAVILAVIRATTVPGTYEQWLAAAAHMAGDFVTLRTNLSIASLGAGFLQALGYSVNVQLAGTLSMVLIVTSLVLWMKPWAMLRQTHRGLDIEFSLFTIAMLLASPLFWNRYQPILMLPLAVLFRYRSDKQSPYAAIAWLVVLTGLCLPEQILEAWNDSLPSLLGSPLSWVLTSAGIFSVMLVAVWTARLSRVTRS